MQKYIINNIKLPYRTSKDAALAIAEKVVRKELSDDSAQKELVDRFVDEVI